MALSSAGDVQRFTLLPDSENKDFCFQKSRCGLCGKTVAGLKGSVPLQVSSSPAGPAAVRARARPSQDHRVLPRLTLGHPSVTQQDPVSCQPTASRASRKQHLPG